jgi:hypothetical protein
LLQIEDSIIKFDNNIFDGSQQDGQQKMEIDLVFCFVFAN